MPKRRLRVGFVACGTFDVRLGFFQRHDGDPIDGSPCLVLAQRVGALLPAARTIELPGRHDPVRDRSAPDDHETLWAPSAIAWSACPLRLTGRARRARPITRPLEPRPLEPRRI